MNKLGTENEVRIPASPTPSTLSGLSAPEMDEMEETRVVLPGEGTLNMFTDADLTRNIERPPYDVNLMARRMQNPKMQIFISYRPEDSGQTAERLCTQFRKHFGTKNVIAQTEEFHIGTNVKKHYRTQFQSGTILVVVIGKYWLEAVDQFGTRKIERHHDVVRTALETALEANVPVIPVLVDGATMNNIKVDELPFSIREVVYHTGAVIHSEETFFADVSTLIRNLEMLFERR
jgi:hypothetical protein